MDRYKIFVFRTSLRDGADVVSIAPAFDLCDSVKSWSVDLDDWERVLRVVARGLTVGDITRKLAGKGFSCSELEYLPNERHLI